MVDAEIAEFNNTLIRSFVALLLGLVLAIFVQVRVGLQPLRRVRDALTRIRSGSSAPAGRKISGRNRSTRFRAQQTDRAFRRSGGSRSAHVSNLAHYLKTPLSVLSSEAEAAPGPLAMS